MRRTLATVVGLAALLIGTIGASSASASSHAGAVFTMSNAAGGNRVLVWTRDPAGTLFPAGSYAAGGLGTGAALGNQGGLTLSHNGRWLYAVDAGSDEVSVFRVHGAVLALVEVASTGDLPISVSAFGRLVYVLHAGGAGGIEGFSRAFNGTLTAIAGSQRGLTNGAAGPAQIGFTPDGRRLIVTEKATGMLDRYFVDATGVAHGPNSVASEGATPFGFGISRNRTLVVAEAFGGVPDASAVSTYKLGPHGGLHPVSSSVPTTETAACWIAITPDGHYVYTTNTGSGTVTGYRLAADGSATILDADGVTGTVGAGSAPIDAGVSSDGGTLYVLASGTHDLMAFRIHADGSLSLRPGVNALPSSANGLAVN